MTKWDSILILYDPQLKPIYAETTVWGDGERVKMHTLFSGNRDVL